jgi:hypothetical protein
LRRRPLCNLPVVLLLVLGPISWCGCRKNPTSLPPAGVTAHTGGAAATGSARNGTAPLFVDVAASAGLNYRWSIPGKRPLTILQTIGNGCAFLDYDNDGNLDILLVGDKLALYRGDGKGHFTDVTAATGLDRLHGHFLGCAVGDYDNDGYEDIYLSGYRTGVLLHNESGRRFTDVTAQAGLQPQPWGTSCAFVDVDCDGKLDLYICDYAKFDRDTRPQLCDFSGIPSSCGPRYYQPERGVLYHNEGGGKFRDVTRAWGAQSVAGKALGVAAADFDGSGHPSLAIANDEMPGDLLHLTGRRFQNIGMASGTAQDRDGKDHGGMGIDWGDYDNDGRLDLAVATFQQEAKCLYHNEGGGYFLERSAPLGIAEKTVPYIAFGIKFLDYDNDGFLDLIIANGHVQDNIDSIDRHLRYRQPTQLFHNVDGARFEEVSARAGAAFQRPIVGRGLAIGDCDNDGRVDVLVVDSEGAPLLLHNEVPAAGHWLSCRLRGVQSNRDGIGAIVTLEAGGRKRMRRCATDGSYLSASDRRVHFGLGTATSANITVRWPSGLSNLYQNVPADRIVTLREGDSRPR